MTHPLTPYSSFVLLKEAPPPSLSPDQVRLAHACLGLATEVLELDISTSRENTEEELGDILWYFTLACVLLEVQYHNLPLTCEYNPKSNEIPLVELKRSAENFLSLCKKLLIYQHSVTTECQASLTLLWEKYLTYCTACAISVPTLISDNRDKLEARYKASFSQEEAATRADKGETNE